MRGSHDGLLLAIDVIRDLPEAVTCGATYCFVTGIRCGDCGAHWTRDRIALCDRTEQVRSTCCARLSCRGQRGPQYPGVLPDEGEQSVVAWTRGQDMKAHVGYVSTSSIYCLGCTWENSMERSIDRAWERRCGATVMLQGVRVCVREKTVRIWPQKSITMLWGSRLGLVFVSINEYTSDNPRQ